MKTKALLFVVFMLASSCSFSVGAEAKADYDAANKLDDEAKKGHGPSGRKAQSG